MNTCVKLTWLQTLLYYFANLIGLTPFSVCNNNLQPVGFMRKVYAVILIVLMSLGRIVVANDRLSSGLENTSLNQFVYGIYVVLRLASHWCTLLTFAFKSNKMIDIINKITSIKDELTNSEIEDHSKKNWKKLYARIIATNTVVLTMKVLFDISHADSGDGTGSKVLFWIGTAMTTMHNHNAVVMFVETMNCITQLFESLNNKLQGNVRLNSDSISSDDLQNSSVLDLRTKRRVVHQGAHGIIDVSENIQLSAEDVEKMGKLHRELCDLVESTTHFYTVPILLAILQHFGRLLSNCYTVYTHVFVSRYALETTETIVPFVQQLVARTMITIVESFLIANACSSMCRVGNATKKVLNKMWNKFYPEELRDELYKFSLQLLDKPVAVLAFGFFDLGYSYVYKIFYAAIAYLIIMVQLDKSETNSGT